MRVYCLEQYYICGHCKYNMFMNSCRHEVNRPIEIWCPNPECAFFELKIIIGPREFEVEDTWPETIG